MIPADSSLPFGEAHPTQHGMLIVWGYFARTIGLLEQMGQVPIAQKAVIRPPQEKILEWLIGLRSGIGRCAWVSSWPRSACRAGCMAANG